MNRESWDSWCERLILAGGLGLLVFGPLALGGVRPSEFLVLQGLILFCALAWMGRILLNERPRTLWPPLAFVVAAFAFYAVFSWIRADIEYTARKEMLQVALYALWFFIVLNNLHRQEHVNAIALVLISVAFFAAGLALYQFIMHSDRVWWFIKPYKNRGSGTFISPNHLGGFLEMILPLALSYALTSRQRPVVKILSGYAGLVIAAGIATTGSRGAWISTVAALMVFFSFLLFHRVYRWPAALLILIMIGGGIYFIPRAPQLKARVQLAYVGGRIDDDTRFDLWVPALKIWREHRWLGAGPGHFNDRFPQYRPESVQNRPDWAHNDYLNTLSDWGIIGLGLVAAALLCLLWIVAKSWRSIRASAADLGGKRTSNKFAFVLGGCCGLAAILVHSCVDFNMHIPANAIVAVTFMALLASHVRFATERFWLKAGPAFKYASAGVLGIIVVLLGYAEARGARETVWLRRAARAPSFSPQKVALLKKAWEAEPRNSSTASQIGEALRVQSSEGSQDYKPLAEEALSWFKTAAQLNPWRVENFLGIGSCLDWLQRSVEATPYFVRAEQLDPNGYYTLALIGRHNVELGNYAAAKPWFERSQRLQWEDNPVAVSYLAIVQARMREAATNDWLEKLKTSTVPGPEAQKSE